MYVCNVIYIYFKKYENCSTYYVGASADKAINHEISGMFEFEPARSRPVFPPGVSCPRGSRSGGR